MENTERKAKQLPVSIWLMILTFLILSILFSSIPGLSGFTLGAAFAFASMGWGMRKFGHLTIGEIITKERFFAIRRVAWLLFLIPFLVAFAVTSNQFLLGFIAAPSVLLLIMLSGMLVIASNTYL